LGFNNVYYVFGNKRIETFEMNFYKSENYREILEKSLEFVKFQFRITNLSLREIVRTITGPHKNNIIIPHNN